MSIRNARGRSCALLLMLVLALTAQSLVARGAVTVTATEYHGWQGAYQMSNGTVELVFVPQIGRIMRFGFVGGPNVLWENPALAGKVPDPAALGSDWVNYGGDKLWNAPQDRWHWPPDPVLDRGGQTATILPNRHLLVVGRVSPTSKLQFKREIALDGRGAGVTVKNTLINAGAENVSWSVWEVAQVDEPQEVSLPLSATGRFAEGYRVFPDSVLLPGMVQVKDDQVAFHRNAGRAAKIGVDSPQGWIRARVAGQRFTLSSAYEPGAEYPDEGCPLQAYVNDDPLKYAEMELLSPMRMLRPGRSATFTTHWKLAR